MGLMNQNLPLIVFCCCCHFFFLLAWWKNDTFVLKAIDICNLSLLVKLSSPSLLCLRSVPKPGFNGFIVPLSLMMFCTNQNINNK